MRDVLFGDPEVGPPLGGQSTGFRKLVVGRKHWRVIYRVDDSGSVEICEVWCVGVRSDSEVYAEAAARVAAIPDPSSALLRLADVITTLSRLAGDVSVELTPRPEPVPDWLAHRLVNSVGIPAEQARQVTLAQGSS